MDLATLGITAATGGLTGFLGPIFGRIAGYFERKQEHKFAVKQWEENERIRLHEIARAEQNQKFEVELHEMNLKAKQEEFEHLVVTTELQTSREGLTASIESDTAATERVEAQWVTNVKALIRPALTVLSMVILTIVFFFVPDEIRELIVLALVYIAVTSVVWWFGDRAPSQMRNALFKEAA